jgi:hypothetical protein
MIAGSGRRQRNNAHKAGANFVALEGADCYEPFQLMQMLSITAALTERSVLFNYRWSNEFRVCHNYKMCSLFDT